MVESDKWPPNKPRNCRPQKACIPPPLRNEQGIFWTAYSTCCRCKIQLTTGLKRRAIARSWGKRVYIFLTASLPLARWPIGNSTGPVRVPLYRRTLFESPCSLRWVGRMCFYSLGGFWAVYFAAEREDSVPKPPKPNEIESNNCSLCVSDYLKEIDFTTERFWTRIIPQL